MGEATETANDVVMCPCVKEVVLGAMREKQIDAPPLIIERLTVHERHVEEQPPIRRTLGFQSQIIAGP